MTFAMVKKLGLLDVCAQCYTKLQQLSGQCELAQKQINKTCQIDPEHSTTQVRKHILQFVDEIEQTHLFYRQRVIVTVDQQKRYALKYSS